MLILLLPILITITIQLYKPITTITHSLPQQLPITKLYKITRIKISNISQQYVNIPHNMRINNININIVVH